MPSQYREPEPVILEELEEEQEETSGSETLDIQTMIETQNPQNSADILGTGTTLATTTVQPGRGKVKLLDNYSGDRTASGKSPPYIML